MALFASLQQRLPAGVVDHGADVADRLLEGRHIESRNDDQLLALVGLEPVIFPVCHAAMALHHGPHMTAA